MTCEAMRGCGYREAGGIYGVGNGATVGGTVANDCRFVRLDPAIPFPKDAPDPRRGYVYVDGEAILDGQPPDTWKITPGWAEAMKLMWELWGMGRERFDNGLCAGAHGTHQVRDALQALAWAKGSAEAWPSRAHALVRAVEELRQGHGGDCALVPAIMEVRRLMFYGPLRQDPAGTLAALRRLVTELSWVAPLSDVVVATASTIMEAMGAGADVPLLKKFYYKEEEHGREKDL